MPTHTLRCGLEGLIDRGLLGLCEYRTRLVADAVTGELDVRAAEELPEQASGTPEKQSEIELGDDIGTVQAMTEGSDA